MSRRVGIVGSRPPPLGSSTFDRELFGALLNDVITFVRGLPHDAVVISGGARGVDEWAAQVARERALDVVEFLPFDVNGEAKFLMRNQRIIDDSTELHAFIAPWAKGSWDSVRRGKRAGLPITIYRRPK